ncbi:TMEM175 family protein [Pseudonocardia spinosispora]|uniref:TMEM175 family protein n=1 Tax=Pseudonocardia spinosispora TaxID=103441 RepID=UPI0003F5A366|nr:TMEM175 family protein [Pseudonocardia spinosispora]
MSELITATPHATPDPTATGGSTGDAAPPPHRVALFSDAVFAVIITILVLELHPPRGVTFAALVPLWPTALSYAVSFLFIAIVWLNHHHLLSRVPAVTPRLTWANFAHLFSVSLLPFTTSWVADSHLANAPVSLYAVVFAATNASYLVLCWEAMDRPQVGDEDMRRFMRLRSWTTLGVFLAGAAVAMASAVTGMALVVLCLFFYLRPGSWTSPR